MSRQQYDRRAKRNRTVVEVLSESEEESSIPLVLIEDSPGESEEDDRTKRKKRQSSKKETYPSSSGKVRLAPIFLSRKEREKPKEKPVMSEATRSFLYSGVPDVIARTQKAIEKKKVEVDALDSLDIFPLYTHNILIDDLRCSTPVDFSKSRFPVASEERVEILKTKIGVPARGHSSVIDGGRLGLGEFCCGVDKNEPSARLLKIMKLSSAGRGADPHPWTEKYKLNKHPYLVVQADSQTKFKDWLKEWRRDIRDDGGASRKLVKKRRKVRDSDSDFIDDEEGDPEMKNKSVILTGPTGSGKSTMVHVMAKRFGFKVVEVNFSSRRSGQEVLRRVEEATLSRRLSTGVSMDDMHCLLLFRDIDQIFTEEDEGFHSAVAHLIAASLRPIVMTLTATHADAPIDSKIESKNPLQIPIGIPSAELIVTNVLVPIIRREVQKQDPDYDFDEEVSDSKYIRRILDSIVGHCGCDIKKCINQTQLLWYTTPFTLRHVHTTFARKLDINYTTPVVEAGAPSKSSKVSQEVMDGIAKNFEFLTDLDRMVVKRSIVDEDTLPVDFNCYFESNFYSMLEQERMKNQREEQQSEESNGNNNNLLKKELDNGVQNDTVVNLFRSLTFRTERTMAEWRRSDGTFDEIVTRLEKMGNQEDYDEVAYFRSILKNGVINSIGQRNARIRTHFHFLMGRDHINSLCDNLDFGNRLQIANQLGGIIN